MEVLGIGFVIVLCFALIAYSVVVYVLASKSLQQIAARRGIKNPWLAWVPVANSWLIGSISDQYKQRKYGYDPDSRTTLLVLSIIAQSGSLLINIFNLFNNNNLIQFGSLDMVPLVLTLLVALAVLGVAIAQAVYVYKAYYDIFASCKPNFAVLFLVLSIVTPAQPFLLYACRNDDAGMPAENQA